MYDTMYDTISFLNRYMLSEENMCKANQVQYNKHFRNEVKHTSTSTVISKVRSTADNSIKNKVFTPYQKDKLFWCFYAMVEGIDAVNQARHHSFKTEMNYKYSLINAIRENKQLLKEMGIKLSEVEVDLTSRRIITIPVFIALCIARTVPVIYVSGRTYMELCTDNLPRFIVKKTEEGYSLIFDGVAIATQNIRSTLFKVENYKKPLKAISRYTVAELYEICQRLKLSVVDENGRKKIKKTIYNLAVQTVGDIQYQ